MNDAEKQQLRAIWGAMDECIMRDVPPSIGDVLQWAKAINELVLADRPRFKFFVSPCNCEDRILKQHYWKGEKND